MIHESPPCPICRRPTPTSHLAEAAWQPAGVVDELVRLHPYWRRADGACPACVQDALLRTLLARGDTALHGDLQDVWPLDSEAAFGVLPTPLRMHADPRFDGQGVTLALVDSGFYPHPDLIQPTNRIRAWVDASREPVHGLLFGADETPVWPGWDASDDWQWHGLMTSAVAAGNGWLSHGLYRGLASGADLVLIAVRDADGRITSASIARALGWIQEYRAQLGVRVISLSVAGDPPSPDNGTGPMATNPVDAAVAELVRAGATVVAAAGNDGVRRLLPPATAPEAITVGGIDDKGLLDHEAIELWHSNYGISDDGMIKPELVAPSIWVVAPILPGTTVADEAAELFAARAAGDLAAEARITELKLVTPYYQHVDGTSFAAPIIASTVACMLQANPLLTPAKVRSLLVAAAHLVPDAPRERQGAGTVDVGHSVALALGEYRDEVQG